MTKPVSFRRRIELAFSLSDVPDKPVLIPATLNIAFQVERNLDAEPSSALISIYNLNAQSRDRLSLMASRVGDDRHWDVTLKAGYAIDPNEELPILFQGHLRNVRHRREAPNMITEVEADDGGRAYAKQVSRHFQKGTTITTVFRFLQRQSGLGEGNVLRVAQIGNRDALPNVIEHGMTVRGFVMDELGDLARSREIRVSSQNGEITLLEPGQRLPGATVSTVNETTGLVGSPVKDAELTLVQHRLLPQAAPGHGINVESQFAAGEYVVDRVLHYGSLFGSDFTSEFECMELAQQ